MSTPCPSLRTAFTAFTAFVRDQVTALQPLVKSIRVTL